MLVASRAGGIGDRYPSGRPGRPDHGQALRSGPSTATGRDAPIIGHRTGAGVVSAAVRVAARLVGPRTGRPTVGGVVAPSG
jgi:hypothetical protein